MNENKDQIQLNELRQLYRANPNNIKIREQLAKELFGVLNDAGEFGDIH